MTLFRHALALALVVSPPIVVAACSSSGGATGAASDSGSDLGIVGIVGSGSDSDGGPRDGAVDQRVALDTGAGVDRTAPDDGEAGDTQDIPDAMGVTLTITTSVHFTSLDWSIAGPHSYSGTVHTGDAQSIEFAVGGIEAGDGYTITLTGIDQSGDSCTGTSLPFIVQAGQVTNTTLIIHCTSTSDVVVPTDVATGS